MLAVCLAGCTPLGPVGRSPPRRPRAQHPSAPSAPAPPPAPQVVTGFLGAGKTTFINYLLSNKEGKKIAIIENEFGEVGIDDGLVLETKVRTPLGAAESCRMAFIDAYAVPRRWATRLLVALAAGPRGSQFVRTHAASRDTPRSQRLPPPCRRKCSR